MNEYTFSLISEKRIDEVSDMLAPEIVSAVKDDLPVTAIAVLSDGEIAGALGGYADTNEFIIESIYISFPK